MPPTELSDKIQWRIPSPSGEKVAILRQDGTTEKSPASVLEIWTCHGQQLSLRIPLDNKVHGIIVNDRATFGQPSWSPDETVLAYSAERNLPETTSFFAQLNPSKTSQHVGNQNALNIGKTETWGEKYHKQSALLDLYCLNVMIGKIGLVRNVPGDDPAKATTHRGGFALGQPVFSPDGTGLVYTAWDAGGGSQMPRRLGMMHCQQRRRQLYFSSIQKLLESLSCPESTNGTTKNGIWDTKVNDCPCKLLSGKLKLASSPRFAPVKDKKSTLVFLGSVDGFDTHSGCLQLFSMEWSMSLGFSHNHEVIIDTVLDPRTSRYAAHCEKVDGLEFPGLYQQSLPPACFVSPDVLLVETQWGPCTKVVRVSLHEPMSLTTTIAPLRCGGHDHECNSELLVCVSRSGRAIVISESPVLPALLYHFSSSLLDVSSIVPSGRIPNLHPIAAARSPVSSSSPLKSAKTITFCVDMVTPTSQEASSFDLPLRIILLVPKASKKKPPLIVIPHGGPHAISPTVYSPTLAFLCGHARYAVLLVNYRGSTGFGKSSIEALPGNVGSLDVADVVRATVEVQQSGLVDEDRIGIYGGSHGGFLAGHCTSRYPKLFKAAAMRNPVIDMASMVSTTDIPDWCYVEGCGGSYDWSKHQPPSREQVLMMHNKSPIAHVSKVRAPTLVAVGLCDLRVPPSQGTQWYYALRSKGVPTKLLTYPTDDHTIGNVCSEADLWLNIKRWFDLHLCQRSSSS